MARKAISDGAQLYGQTKVVNVSGTRVVTESGKEIVCRRVIIAVDGSLEKILPEL